MSEEKNPDRKTPTILIVDDETSILRLLNVILTRAKYRVITADAGLEALELLDKHSIDCVVTDTIMPLMSGYDLARTIRRNSKHSKIPILMLTRKNKREDVAQALQAGVTDYIIKPVDELLLLDKIALLLNAHTEHAAESHVFEVPVSEPESLAQLRLPCRIAMMSETKMLVRFTFPFTREMNYKFNTEIFDRIGIKEPILQISSIKDLGAENTGEFRYEVGFAFLGLSEIELQKLRAWIQRQQIRLRK